MHHFWTQNGPFATNFFLEKVIIIFIYLLAHFIVQNFKKNYFNVRMSYTDAPFLGPK